MRLFVEIKDHMHMLRVLRSQTLTVTLLSSLRWLRASGLIIISLSLTLRSPGKFQPPSINTVAK